MAGLVSAIQNSTAPRRLIIRGGNFFSKKELWNPFLQAVGSSSVSPTSLALFVSFTRWAHLGFFPALIAALGRNTVIERLLVTFDMVHLWPDIVLSLSTHPRLRSLDLCFVCDGYDVEFPVDQVAQLLRENENIEKVRFRATMYDRHEWEMIIIPLLKCNKFRKIQTLTATEQRPGRNWNALLAQAIISMKSRPTLLWMLISQNQGSIVTSISQD